MAPADEQQLIEQSRAGDLDAFNHLIELYQDQAFSVALRMVRNRATAEDLTQDAFISAFKNLGQFRGDSFRGWLLRIVKNAAYDWLRRNRRRPTESIDENIITFERTLESSNPTPHDLVLNAELGETISGALGNLPNDQRMAVVLVDMEGFSYEEAAESMEVSVGTVKSRLSRGRARLRDALLQETELLPAGFRRRGEGGD